MDTANVSSFDQSDVLDDDDDFEIDRTRDTYLVFSIGEEEYGVAVQYVTEIVRMQRIIHVPDVPPFIRGVINLRGRIIPVMDVRRRFKMPAREYCDRTVIIILDTDGAVTGLAVDAVNEVLELAPEQIEPLADTWTGNRAEQAVIRGVSRRADRATLVLDARQLVHSEGVAAPEAVCDVAEA